MKLTDKPALMKEISRNRKVYFLKNNIIPQKVISAEIIHGNKIAIAREKDSGKIILGTDGLITKGKGIYLSITSADCLPIFLFDPKNNVVGIIHAGWRSLSKNIISNAINKIEDKFQSNPQNILTGIGPAICQKHYEIGPEVAEKFEKYAEATKKEDKKIYLDLKKIAQLQLLEAGLQEKYIEISPECTYELPEKYFSARRDKSKEIEAMIAAIGMKA